MDDIKSSPLILWFDHSLFLKKLGGACRQRLTSTTILKQIRKDIVMCATHVTVWHLDSVSSGSKLTGSQVYHVGFTFLKRASGVDKWIGFVQVWRRTAFAHVSFAPGGDAVIISAKTITAASPAQNISPSFTQVQSCTFNATFSNKNQKSFENKPLLTGFPHEWRKCRRRVQHYHETWSLFHNKHTSGEQKLKHKDKNVSNESMRIKFPVFVLLWYWWNIVSNWATARF